MASTHTTFHTHCPERDTRRVGSEAEVKSSPLEMELHNVSLVSSTPAFTHTASPTLSLPHPHSPSLTHTLLPSPTLSLPHPLSLFHPHSPPLLSHPHPQSLTHNPSPTIPHPQSLTHTPSPTFPHLDPHSLTFRRSPPPPPPHIDSDSHNITHPKKTLGACKGLITK